MNVTLSSAPGVDDAEDGYAVRFAPVLDDVILEVKCANVRRSALDWMAYVGKQLDQVEGVIKDLIVSVSLACTPSCERVLKDAFSLTLRAWSYEKANT